jgi:hypothetical protein
MANDLIYLVVGFGMQKGKIWKYSTAAPEFFGYEEQEFVFLNSVQNLIPLPVVRYHDSMVENFLSRGQSRYFRNIQRKFALSKQGYLKPMHMFYDINFLIEEDFTFIAFIKKIDNET